MQVKGAFMRRNISMQCMLYKGRPVVYAIGLVSDLESMDDQSLVVNLCQVQAPKVSLDFICTCVHD